MNLAVGQIIGGDFELVRQLGEGGMGVVWLATERSLGRNVALKIMRPSEGAARVRRFEREAHALAALNHPSIITVLRTGTDAETGLHYIATPAILLTPDKIRHLCDEVLRCPYPSILLQGPCGLAGSPQRGAGEGPSRPLTLADLLDGGKALPETTVARIARDLASALSVAHAAGILHRDVKPSNILFDAAGRALLADFGLAKFTATVANGAGGAGESPVLCDSLSLDGTGNPKFLGTPSYAAPEAFKKGVAATSALDWYSLGAVLHEALTGDRPRSLRPPSSYDRKHISRAWDPLLRDLLEPDPARRLADPAVFLRRLARVGRRPRRLWPAFALAGCATVAAALWISAIGSQVPGVAAVSQAAQTSTVDPQVSPASEETPATPAHTRKPLRMKPAPRARGPAYLNQTPETYPPVTPAAIQPPRQTNIWQGENSGPLQLLNTFAFPDVDHFLAVPTNGEFAVIAPLFKEGDAAWLGLDRSRFLADVSYSNECVEAMEKAKKIYSEIVARIDANPRRQMEMAPPECRAVALVRSAWINIFLNRLGESDNLYALALEGVTPLAEHDSEEFGPLCSWFLSERAYMKCMEGRFEEAIPDLEEALTLLESNIIRSKPGCAVQEAVLHASLGGMYRNVGQNEKALEDTSEAIDIAEGILSSTSSATNHPSTFQPFIDFLAGCHYRRDEIRKDLAKQR